MFNKYVGRNDVLYIHARIGGGNWNWYNCDEIIKAQPWFLDVVEDAFDCTYVDIYAKIGGGKVMEKVFIKKNTLGDTRTAEHMPTREEFNEANELHIDDVKHLTKSFCDEMLERISHHDWTKVSEPYATMFYDDMKANIEDGKEPFVDMKWYELHVNTERHHLNDRVPEDVDLIDVVERLVDCVSAGMARSGSVYDVTVPDDVLQKAVANTVNKMINAVIVYDPAAVVESEEDK